MAETSDFSVSLCLSVCLCMQWWLNANNSKKLRTNGACYHGQSIHNSLNFFWALDLLALSANRSKMVKARDSLFCVNVANTSFTWWSKHQANMKLSSNRPDGTKHETIMKHRSVWSKHEAYLEHTLCTCILNTFALSLLHACFIV